MKIEKLDIDNIIDEGFHQYRGYVIKQNSKGFYECDNKEFRNQSQVKRYINESLMTESSDDKNNRFVIVGVFYNGGKMYFSSEDSDWHNDIKDATIYDNHDDALQVWTDVTRNGNAKYINKVLGFKRVFVPIVD